MIKKKLDELERKDITGKVKSPSHWVSPVVEVLKPKGELRLVDMRQANYAVQNGILFQPLMKNFKVSATV